MIEKLKNKVINFVKTIEEKYQITDKIGHLIFVIGLIIVSPAFMVVGGLLTPFRFYKYIRSQVYNHVPKKYFY